MRLPGPGCPMNLYQLARLWRTLTVVSSGNPKRIARRGKNILLGRLLARLLRRLW